MKPKGKVLEWSVFQNGGKSRLFILIYFNFFAMN